MKGIVFAGGFGGTHLCPITKDVPNYILPIYDKPMVYYPISVGKQAEIRDILIISTPFVDLPEFKCLFGDSSVYSVKFTHLGQPCPGALAKTFIIGNEFVDADSVCPNSHMC